MTLTLRTKGQTVRVERPVAPSVHIIGDYRVTVEPCPRPDDVQASDGGDASAKEPGRW